MVYECPSIWRTFEPFILLKKYKNRHSDDIVSAKFSPDSRFLLTCGKDSIIYMNILFPLEGYIAMTFEVHRFKILGISFSPKMDYMYSVDSGSNVYVWKWVQENLTEGYQNLKASKMRRRDQKRGGSRNTLKKEGLKNEEEVNEEMEEEGK